MQRLKWEKLRWWYPFPVRYGNFIVAEIRHVKMQHYTSSIIYEIVNENVLDRVSRSQKNFWGVCMRRKDKDKLCNECVTLWENIFPFFRVRLSQTDDNVPSFCIIRCINFKPVRVENGFPWLTFSAWFQFWVFTMKEEGWVWFLILAEYIRNWDSFPTVAEFIAENFQFLETYILMEFTKHRPYPTILTAITNSQLDLLKTPSVFPINKSPIRFTIIAQHISLRRDGHSMSFCFILLRP